MLLRQMTHAPPSSTVYTSIIGLGSRSKGTGNGGVPIVYSILSCNMVSG